MHDARVQVADVAGKEYAIETALDKMQREWESTELQVLEYRETGTHIIKVPIIERWICEQRCRW